MGLIGISLPHVLTAKSRSRPLVRPTEDITTEHLKKEPQNSPIHGFFEVQKRQPMDSEAIKLWIARSGKDEQIRRREPKSSVVPSREEFSPKITKLRTLYSLPSIWTVLQPHFGITSQSKFSSGKEWDKQQVCICIFVRSGLKMKRLFVFSCNCKSFEHNTRLLAAKYTAKITSWVSVTVLSKAWPFLVGDCNSETSEIHFAAHPVCSSQFLEMHT